MKEDMREILTMEQVFADIKNRCWSEIKSIICLNILASLMFPIIIRLFSLIIIKFSFNPAIYIIAALLPHALSFYQIYGLIRCLKAIYSGKYKIVTDKVIGKEENYSLFEFQFHDINNMAICYIRRRFALHFSSYNRYLFGKSRYTESNLLYTDVWNLYHSTHEGDEFYLAVVEDRWILSIYNVKYFRLSH